MVLQQKMTIVNAGKILGIKKSTAKVIIRKFKQTGKITIFKEDQPYINLLLKNDRNSR